jgi:hypothetical protein
MDDEVEAALDARRREAASVAFQGVLETLE